MCFLGSWWLTIEIPRTLNFNNPHPSNNWPFWPIIVGMWIIGMQVRGIETIILTVMLPTRVGAHQTLFVVFLATKPQAWAPTLAGVLQYLWNVLYSARTQCPLTEYGIAWFNRCPFSSNYMLVDRIPCMEAQSLYLQMYMTHHTKKNAGPFFYTIVHSPAYFL